MSSGGQTASSCDPQNQERKQADAATEVEENALAEQADHLKVTEGWGWGTAELGIPKNEQRGLCLSGPLTGMEEKKLVFLGQELLCSSVQAVSRLVLMKHILSPLEKPRAWEGGGDTSR